MSKLDEIIEKKARKLFDNDVIKVGFDIFISRYCTLEKVYAYIIDCKLDYFLRDYPITTVFRESNMGAGIIRDIVWPKLKDTYIAQVVENLEKAIMPEPNIQKVENDSILLGEEYVMVYTPDPWTTETKTVKFKKLIK